MCLESPITNQTIHTMVRPSSAINDPAIAQLTGSVFAGKDASRALAKSSLKPEDCVPEWYDLDPKEKKTLDDWFTFFSKRYNIVGKVEGAENT